jgi:hypothetical protein
VRVDRLGVLFPYWWREETKSQNKSDSSTPYYVLTGFACYFPFTKIFFSISLHGGSSPTLQIPVAVLTTERLSKKKRKFENESAVTCLAF